MFSSAKSSSPENKEDSINLIDLDGADPTILHESPSNDSASIEDMVNGESSSLRSLSFHGDDSSHRHYTPPSSPLSRHRQNTKNPPPAHLFKHRGSLHGSFHGGSFNHLTGSLHSASSPVPRSPNGSYHSKKQRPSLRDSIAGSDHLRLDESLRSFADDDSEESDDEEDSMNVSFHTTATSTSLRRSSSNPYSKSKTAMERSNRSVSFVDETSDSVVMMGSSSPFHRQSSRSLQDSFPQLPLVPNNNDTKQQQQQEEALNRSLDIFLGEDVPEDELNHSSIHLIRERDSQSLTELHGRDEDMEDYGDDEFVDALEEEDQDKKVRNKILMAVGGMGAMAFLGWSAKKIMSKMGGEDPGDLAESANAASEVATHATQEAASETAAHLATDLAAQSAMDSALNVSISSASSTSFSTSQSSLAVAGAGAANNGAAGAAAK